MTNLDGEYHRMAIPWIADPLLFLGAGARTGAAGRRHHHRAHAPQVATRVSFTIPGSFVPGRAPGERIVEQP